jgi:two-component system chemotaxis response regulator CheB
MTTKVLVVDDSAFMRKIISDIIDEDIHLNVVGTARNGQDALQKINILKPDVITLDVEMPLMDGITTLEQIMTTNPVPVIMLSGLTSEGAEATVKALERGAVDFIAKPVGINISQLKDELIYKIKTAAKVKVNKTIKHPDSRQPRRLIVSNLPVGKTALFGNADKILVMGTSTGGPKALQEVLPLLPENFPAPILIVQHMPPGFTKSLANRLNSLCAIRVKEAEEGEVLYQGVAYIAPGDFHLTIAKDNYHLVVKLTTDPLVNGHRPSVSVMMESVCNNFHGKIIGVIMTGMGSDGVEGMKLIKEKKGITIAEAEETCVVFGMPKAAIQANCIDQIIPLHDIADETIKSMRD